MTAYTKTQLVKDVLLALKVVAPEETPAADDHSYVAEMYDKKIAEWSDRDLVYWPNTDDLTAEIPSAIHTILCDLIANQVGRAFGKGSPNVADILATEEYLLKGLRRHKARVASGFPTKVDTY